jgi:hypothetical protein
VSVQWSPLEAKTAAWFAWPLYNGAAMAAPRLVSRDAAAGILGGVSTKTVDRLRAAGALETKHVGRRALIVAASLYRFIEGRRPADRVDPFPIPVLDAERQRKREAA